ncbi:MAG: efflux RND transporter periplasmic adaptor subunit [Methylococcales bacterium]|nr:efflux RND transporter periplasmic adaptor subunit [Methylococcales bacterium]
MPVRVVLPAHGAIESVIRVTGKVINDQTVTLTALVDGQIQLISVQKGDRVKTGQVLAKQDDRKALALFNKAKAEAEREEQKVGESQRKYKRMQKTSRSGGVSDQSVEDTKAEWLVAKARLKVVRAEYQIAKINRDKTNVTAPFAGIITEKTAEVGQWLEAGGQLFTLVAHDGREIEMNVDAGDSASIHLDQAVVMTTDTYPDKEWQETVHWISSSITENEKEAINTFSVRMTLSRDAPDLLLNQQVDARILIDRRDNILKIPFEALVEKRDGVQIAVLEGDKVKFLSIETGIEDFTHVEILKGLSEHTQIILSEGEILIDGQKVHVNLEEQP